MIFLTICYANAQRNELTTAVNNYLSDVANSRKWNNEAEKQAAYHKAKDSAMTLLGVVPGLKLNSYDKMKAFCNLLLRHAESLRKTLSFTEEEREKLKTRRDITNYKEAAKFLMCCSSLLDAMYADPTLVDLILQKLPETIPVLAQEITVMLYILKFILQNPTKTDEPMEKLREFATSSEDGTYLLSQLISVAMSSTGAPNFKNLLTRDDISNADNCSYLKIR
jgi:hypothetical protein